MKFLVTACTLLLFFVVHSQEYLEPLQYNTELLDKKSQQKSSSDLDNSFIYLFDTVSLPFIDDFSTDKFFVLDAVISDSNVLDSMWFKLLDSNANPFDVSSTFMEDTSYTYQYDSVTINGVDTLTVSAIPLPSQIIEVFDLNNYPLLSTFVEVWPSYSIYDTLFISVDVSDTILLSDVDLQQDSLKLYFVVSTTTDYASLWQDEFVFKNDNFPVGL